MSSDLYEVLSLAARYLFTLLGVLIVLRAFTWLLSDHAEKRRRLRALPDAGTVGELVVLAGGPDLPEGTAIPVPWEGILGSVRSCDLWIPCSGIRKRHLSFSFQAGLGLLLHPFSRCEARVNQNLITCNTRESDFPLAHGSFLQVGSALLRLRLFAGLDPAAGFEENSAVTAPASDFAPVMPPRTDMNPVETGFPFLMNEATNVSGIPADLQEEVPCPQEITNFVSAPIPEANSSPVPGEAAQTGRRRRSERWEADWSD